MTERELVRIFYSRRWRAAPWGWTMELDRCTVEARREKRLWQARACADGNCSNWSAFHDTRWRAALTAVRSLEYEQFQLDL